MAKKKNGMASNHEASTYVKIEEEQFPINTPKMVKMIKESGIAKEIKVETSSNGHEYINLSLNFGKISIVFDRYAIGYATMSNSDISLPRKYWNDWVKLVDIIEKFNEDLRNNL